MFTLSGIHELSPKFGPCSASPEKADWLLGLLKNQQTPGQWLLLGSLGLLNFEETYSLSQKFGSVQSAEKSAHFIGSWFENFELARILQYGPKKSGYVGYPSER